MHSQEVISNENTAIETIETKTNDQPILTEEFIIEFVNMPFIDLILSTNVNALISDNLLESKFTLNLLLKNFYDVIYM